MNIKILFDSTKINDRLITGWGFSCLINNQILFDTGENGNILLNNLNVMNIKLSDIKKIIISHEHYDHIGGLWSILEKQPNLPVYICPNFDSLVKAKIKIFHGTCIESSSFQEIEKNIFITGEVEGTYKGISTPEQSVIVKTEKGLVLITGCAHPGIIEIINKIKEYFFQDKIYLVLGGFHLLTTSETEIEIIIKNFQALAVEKVALLHCNGNKAKEIFKEYYDNNYIDLRVGETLEI